MGPVFALQLIYVGAAVFGGPLPGVRRKRDDEDGIPYVSVHPNGSYYSCASCG